MDAEGVEALLRQVQQGAIDIEQALDALSTLPYASVGDFAVLDTHRALRTGLPEVVYCPGKSPEQTAQIVARLAQQPPGRVLATRATAEQYERVRSLVPAATHHELARLITVGDPPAPRNPVAAVAVVTAGTADTPVGEEAAITLDFIGVRAERCYDVGVAGLHRVLDRLDLLRSARAVIVCAGMEGALAGVVAGLVARPVVAVPTSVGYGASFGGVAALLSMLNACSGGVAVVNIDNGFGVAVYASRIVSA